MRRFEGKTFLITGAASGIGAATAKRLASEGALVCVADISHEKAMAVVEEITQTGGRSFFQNVDLSKADSIDRMGRDVACKIERLHGLVNNAAIVRFAKIEEINDTDWEPQVSINLRAPALCVKALLPLLKAGPGSIVNMSSEAAFNPTPGRWVYDATKAGICALTRSMADELVEYGIRANSVAPGCVVTEMHYNRDPDPAKRKQEMENAVFDRAILNRMARPEEIASVIAFLMSDDASYLTATTIHADGGQVAR